MSKVTATGSSAPSVIELDPMDVLKAENLTLKTENTLMRLDQLRSEMTELEEAKTALVADMSERYEVDMNKYVLRGGKAVLAPKGPLQEKG